MKKLLLGLGSIAAVIAPIVAVVSCGDNTTTNNTNTGMTIDAHKKGIHATIGHLQASNIVQEVAQKAKTYHIVGLDKHNKKDFVIAKASNLVTVQKVIDDMKAFALIFNVDLDPTSGHGSFGMHGIFAFFKHGGHDGYAAPSITLGTVINFNLAGGTKHTHTISPSDKTALETMWKTTHPNDREELIKEFAKLVGNAAITTRLEALVHGQHPTIVAAVVGVAFNLHGADSAHALFRVGGKRSIPADGQEITVAITGRVLSYTWASADTSSATAVGFLGSTKTQVDMLTYLASKLASTAGPDRTAVLNVFKAFGYHGLGAIA